MSIFTGSGVAIVTPFNQDGSVNYERLAEFVDWQIVNKTDCIVVAGTTGEASTMNDDEHLEVIRVAVDAAKGRVPVIAGTGSNDTAHGIRLSKKAQQYGVDGLLQVIPYYNKTSQRGLLAHFGAIANSVDVPIMVYNVPSRTGMVIAPETMVELAKIDNIVATKEASGDIGAIMKTMALTQGDIDLYSGNDDQIVPLLSLGGKGVVSVLGNMMPEVTHNIVDLYMQGKHAESLQLQLDMHEIMTKMFIETNPIPIKAAMNLAGMNVGPCRLPLYEMDPKNIDILRTVMKAYGVEVKN